MKVADERKFCKYCGEEIRREDYKKISYWRDRTFCSRSCGANGRDGSTKCVNKEMTVAEQVSNKFLYTYKPANAVCGEAG